MTQEPRLGCGAAILQQGKLLLIKRRRAPEADHWGLPGGKVDLLETVEHAVGREINEELGIRLGDLELLCVVDLIDADGPEHWVAPVYLATQFEGTPHLVEPEKHSDFGWFALDALPEPLTESTRVAARHLRSRMALAPNGAKTPNRTTLAAMLEAERLAARFSGGEEPNGEVP